jgi:O-antigen/teichoic acid export membrane protein
MNVNILQPYSLTMKTLFKGLYSSYFGSAAMFLALRTLVVGAAGLISQSLLAHALEREDFGSLVWAWTMISVLAPFGLPGISASITGAVARGCDRNFVRGSVLELLGGLCGGMVFIAMAMTYYFRHQEVLFWIFIIAGVTCAGVWLDTPLSLWNGRKNFRAIFMYSTLLRLTQLAVLVAVLHIAPYPAVVFASQAGLAAAGNIGVFLYLKRVGRLNDEYSREFEAYGWRYTWLSLAGTLSSYMDKLIIGTFFGLKNLAVFAIGELLYSYVFKEPSYFVAQIFIPRLAQMKLCDAIHWVCARYWYLAGTFVAAAILAAFLLPYVYPLLFSVRYSESIYYGYVFLVGVAASSPTVLLGALLISHALKRETTFLSCFIATAPLVTVTFGVFVAGVPGVAWGRVAGYVVISIAYIGLQFSLARRYA